MGAGRKTQTFVLNDNKIPILNQAPYSGFRNLGKSQLGGVIFGCKNATLKECLNNQLFGQSFSLWSPVKIIVCILFAYKPSGVVAEKMNIILWGLNFLLSRLWYCFLMFSTSDARNSSQVYQLLTCHMLRTSILACRCFYSITVLEGFMAFLKLLALENWTLINMDGLMV